MHLKLICLFFKNDMIAHCAQEWCRISDCEAMPVLHPGIFCDKLPDAGRGRCRQSVRPVSIRGGMKWRGRNVLPLQEGRAIRPCHPKMTGRAIDPITIVDDKVNRLPGQKTAAGVGHLRIGAASEIRRGRVRHQRIDGRVCHSRAAIPATRKSWWSGCKVRRRDQSVDRWRHATRSADAGRWNCPSCRPDPHIRPPPPARPRSWA